MTSKTPLEQAVANAERTKRLLDHVTAKYADELAIVAALRPEAQGTSPEVASIAAKGLASPESLDADEIKCVCASALSQKDGGGDDT